MIKISKNLSQKSEKSDIYLPDSYTIFEFFGAKKTIYFQFYLLF